MANARRKTRLGDIRIKPDVNVQVVEETRPCNAKGCAAEGKHRVPRDRNDLSEHIWLCLAHARAHNESWDFFAGMTEKDIERFQVDAIVGHRPTWPLGKRAARARVQGDSRFEGLIDEPTPEPRRAQRRLTGLQLTALATLDLEETAALHEIKARYKELVKRFHPDANGGDRGAEERLKQVIKAYSVLRAAGMT
jgi:DnaJ-domain-containing protein 1